MADTWFECSQCKILTNCPAKHQCSGNGATPFTPPKQRAATAPKPAPKKKAPPRATSQRRASAPPPPRRAASSLTPMEEDVFSYVGQRVRTLADHLFQQVLSAPLTDDDFYE